ncbi:MAG: hypothetical protein FWE14_09920 [Lachnospiraceae bacterium]|nr:hypothetical protein [Lachnospiraceae bacterium]
MGKSLKIMITVTIITVVALFAAYALGAIGGDSLKEVFHEDFNEFNYTGDLRNGRFTGHGLMTFINGGHFEGDFSVGRFAGAGNYIGNNNNWSFKGNFAEGQIVSGDFKFNNNDIKYERGETNDVFTGQSWRYEGFLGDSGQNGAGTFTFPDGSVYTGGFVNGLAEGQGTYTLGSGAVVYQGTFAAGQFDGNGSYFSPEGWSYEGEFKDGLFDGVGILTNGDEVIHGIWEEGIQVTRYAD